MAAEEDISRYRKDFEHDGMSQPPLTMPLENRSERSVVMLYLIYCHCQCTLRSLKYVGSS